MPRRLTLLAGLVLLLIRTTAAGAQANIAPGSVVTTQIIQFSFVLAGKQYHGVLQQQGRLELDADFNESQHLVVDIHVGIAFQWGNVLTVTPGSGATYVARPPVQQFDFELSTLPATFPFEDTVRFVARGQAVPRAFLLHVSVQETVNADGTMSVLLFPSPEGIPPPQ
jgi:hypothetical protein